MLKMAAASIVFARSLARLLDIYTRMCAFAISGRLKVTVFKTCIIFYVKYYNGPSAEHSSVRKTRNSIPIDMASTCVKAATCTTHSHLYMNTYTHMTCTNTHAHAHILGAPIASSLVKQSQSPAQTEPRSLSPLLPSLVLVIHSNLPRTITAIRIILPRFHLLTSNEQHI